jgi:serine/threonine protein kinase
MESNMREMNIPTGCTLEDIVAWGTSGLVFIDSLSTTVIKSPHAEDNYALINVEIERDIYERFAQKDGHEGLLQYFGPVETGIRLEYASNQSILHYLQEHKSDISVEQKLQWCQEISYTLQFIHSNKVVHGDFKCNNIFLDDPLRSKVADFGGSSLDGSELRVMVSASHRGPGVLESIEGDIFALGSTMYEIITGQAPYTGREEEEIVGLFSKSKFPDTSTLGPIGCTIRNCWQGKFASAREVWTSITGFIPSHCFIATLLTPSAIQKRRGSHQETSNASKTTTVIIVTSAICLLAIYWKKRPATR